MPLIYGKMIKCILHILQSDSSTKQTSDTVSKCAKKFMTALSQHLSLYADDKQSWGLLGALGLGKASQLTVKYVLGKNLNLPPVHKLCCLLIN